MRWIKRFPAELVLLIIIVSFFVQRNPSNRYDRIINADMKAYYGYLPALFIYQDMTWSFVDDYETRYYPTGGEHYKEFTKDVNGDPVNKTFPGMMLLLLPFFLAGHGIALLTGGDADGYSMIYQYSILVASWFYLWAGIRMFIKAMGYFKVPFNTALISLSIIVLGTNLFYYSVYDLSVSHVYSFFLIGAFTVLGFRVTHHYERRGLLLLVATFLLIALVRPTNGLVILLLPFLAGSTGRLKHAFSKFIKDRTALLGTLLLAACGIAIPMVLWYLQSGKLIVYSYGEEGFHFDDSHFLSMLISFKKGWLLYTPVAAISFLGLFKLYRINKLRAVNLFIFFLLVVYVYSCWWIWTFGGGFGQRVFVDYYVFIGLLLAWFLISVDRSAVLRAASLMLLILFVGVNQLQAWQTYKGILPGGEVTREMYFDRFFQLRLKARYDVDERLVLSKETSTENMEDGTGDGYTKEKAYRGKQSFKVDKSNAFSAGFRFQLPQQVSVVVRLTAMVNPDTDPEHSSFVMSFHDSSDETIEYIPFFFKDFTKINEWTKVQFGHPAPSGAENVVIYLWNPGEDDAIYVDDMKAEVFRLSSPD